MRRRERETRWEKKAGRIITGQRAGFFSSSQQLLLLLLLFNANDDDDKFPHLQETRPIVSPPYSSLNNGREKYFFPFNSVIYYTKSLS